MTAQNQTDIQRAIDILKDFRQEHAGSMTMQTSNPAAKFVGYHRSSKRERWRAVVQGETDAVAFGKLLDAVAGGDKVVLATGIDPNHQPRPR
jgi:hypothetical protein